jgi:cytochrome c oxidase assembly protein subunit 15
MEHGAIIEYTHRLVASVAGVLVLGVVVMAWRRFRRVPAITYPATLALVMILVQAWLGKVTVERELPAGITAVHLTMALTLLSILVLVTMTSLSLVKTPGREAASAGFGRLAAAAALTTLLLMAVGSYVSGAGYGLACSGWPLCNNELVPSADSISVQMHFLHRFLALLLGLIVIALLWSGLRQKDAPQARGFAVSAAILFAIQALVGAANVWTELATWAGAVHLALGTLLFLLLVVLNVRVHRLDELLPRSQGARAQTDLLGAPR